jgi:hypothetical protein
MCTISYSVWNNKGSVEGHTPIKRSPKAKKPTNGPAEDPPETKSIIEIFFCRIDQPEYQKPGIESS